MKLSLFVVVETQQALHEIAILLEKHKSTLKAREKLASFK